MYINMLPMKTYNESPAPDDFNMNYEKITAVSFDGFELKAWLIKGKDSAPAVIMVHGKGGNKSGLLHLARIVNSKGYHVLLPDLRGHGESGNALMTFGLDEAKDLETIYDSLKRRGNIDSSRVCVYAQSMGSAASVLAFVNKSEIRGFVIDSGFDSLDELIADVGCESYGLPHWLGKMSTWTYRVFTGHSASEVNPAELLSRSDKSVLLFHSKNDRVIPFRRALSLFEKIAGPKRLVQSEAGHTGAWGENPGEYEKKLLKFFDGCFSKEHFDPNSI